jgi:hypothetical protein
MPNAPARSWKILIPLGAVLTIALAWFIYWFAAMEIAKQRFADERKTLAAQGLSLACTSENWGGFPFRFEFSCVAPVVTFKDTAELRSSNLLLVALAYAPWQVTALIDGPSQFSGRNMAAQDATHGRIMAVLTYEGSGKAFFSADIPDLSIPSLGEAGKVMVHSRPSLSGGTDLALSVTKLSYQPEGKPAVLLDQADVLGTLLPDHSLKLENAEIQQGALRYWGSGIVALDSEHRITGRIDTETNDLNRLLDMLRTQRQLSDQQVNGLRTMLGLLGNEAKAAIIAKDGVLYIGPFAAAQLRPLY